METDRLYYKDCHMQTFTATVQSCTPEGKGYAVALDATAFYPEGGGQASDWGTLAEARVLSVREQGQQVVHLCDKPLTPGQAVQGRIHWQHRFDLMQQHTGEHIVSGIIHQKYGYHNVGFHMGAETVTIDFDGRIPEQALEEIEGLANEAVWRNLPVHCWYPGPEELPGMVYRSKRALDWPVRLVEIPDYDTCACCGVHVAHTGEIGLVKLLSCVKFHQGVRIEMVCGGRALSLIRRVYEQNRQVSQAFSVKLLETGEAARQMNARLEAEKLRSTSLQMRILDAVAQEYSGAGNVLHFASEENGQQLRELAERIAAVSGGIAGVFSGTDAQGYRFCLLSHTGSVRGLGEALIALGGRGGGKDECFQGQVKAARQQILSFWKELG